jgi:hypothetical protein
MSPRLLRPLASGFNPKSIAGLSLWLDAADTSKISLATGVATWSDKSGNNRNAIQNTGGKQPSYSSTINGRNVVTFSSATSQTMQIAASAAFNANSQTIIIVSRQATAANESLWYKADSNSAVGVIMRYRTGTTFWL